MGTLTFAASPTGSGTVATQAKLESLLTVFSVKIHMTKAMFNSLPESNTYPIFEMDKPRVGETGTTIVGLQRGTGDNYGMYISQNGFGTASIANISLASIPTNVVIYAFFQQAGNPDGAGFVLFNADTGAVLVDGDGAGGFNVAHQTSAGTGAFTLHNRALASVYQSVAIYSARLTSNARWAAPTTGDANIVALYSFDSGSSTTPDTTSGVAMSITNGTIAGTNGGLLTLTGAGTIASGATLEGLTTWSFKMRISKSVFESLPNSFVARSLLLFDKGNTTDPSDTQLIRVMKDNGGLMALSYITATQGNVSAGYVVDVATLPNYVVIYGQRKIGQNPDGIGAIMYDDAGTLLTGGLVETGGQPAFETGSGTGAITINNDAVSMVWDGLAIYSDVLTGANRYSVPTANDANIVGLYLFQETSGSNAASSVAGPPLMSLTGATWSAGGAWPANSESVAIPAFGRYRITSPF